MKTTCLLTIFLCLTSCKIQENEQTGKYETVVGNPVTGYIETVTNEASKMQIRLLEIQEKQRQERWKSEKVRVYVRAKDTRTCMKLLKIDVINNEVAECNKDRYVEVRNDELEKFKKDNEI